MTDEQAPKARKSVKRRTKKYRQPTLTLYCDDLLAHCLESGEPPESTGARVRLWAFARKRKPAGYLPNDDELLQRWSGCTPEQWALVKPFLVTSWGFDEKGNRYVLRRVRDAAKRSSQISASKTTAAEGRWQGRKSNGATALYAGASPEGSKCNGDGTPSNSDPNSDSGSTYVDPPNPNARAGALASPSGAVAGSGPAARPRPPALPRALPHAAAHPRIRSAVPDHPAVEAYVGIVGETPIQALWGRIAEAVGESPDRIQAWVDHLVWWCSQGYNRSNVAGILDQWELRDREDPEPRNGKMGTPPDRGNPEVAARVSELVSGLARNKAMEGSDGRRSNP